MIALSEMLNCQIRLRPPTNLEINYASLSDTDYSSILKHRYPRKIPYTSLLVHKINGYIFSYLYTYTTPTCIPLCYNSIPNM
jgi:hypothetical protein